MISAMTSADFSTTTPMMAQWHTCKTEAKDAILFFRLGDFYEAFHQDAVLVSKELSLTLTQRQSVPMCGVPFHAAEQYIDKLIARGYKVAVAEQTEDPKAVKGLVKREIVRVVTPGTIVQSQLLQDKKNNYIASVVLLGKIYGLAVLDLTTGEFRVQELEKEQELIDEIYRLRPAEFVAPRKFKASFPAFFEDLSSAFSFLVNELDDWRFNAHSSMSLLLSHFQITTLDSFGLAGKSAAIAASGALLAYLKEDLSLRLEHVVSIQTQALSQFMSIDRSTMRHLELVESLSEGKMKSSLLDLLDNSSTPMGARLLAQWLKAPLLSVEEIEKRQHAIAVLLDHPEKAKRLRQLFERVRDLERLIAKIAARYAGPRDLYTLGHSLSHLPAIRYELEDLSAELLSARLPDISEIAERLCNSLQENPPLRISDGDLFRENVDPELDRLRSLAKDSIAWVANYQGELRERTGIKTLKVGYTKAFGYYIEVSRAKGESVPDEFQRRQTLINSERFVTEELKRYEHQILTAEARAKALETELFEKLRHATAQESDKIRAAAKAIARIDALLSLSLTAKEFRWTCPKLDESDTLFIEKGRHPVLEKAIGSSAFIPNDTHLDATQRLQLITGPNMAGKSTYIRQVALIVILAQMGSYVPATSAHIGLIDKVFSRIGASDDLARGQSTFMVEMSETANILHNATSRSLVILDEIGRGTSTYDGISIAWSVAEHLLTAPGKTAKTLFATHYWELTRLEQEHPAAVNVHVAVSEEAHGIVFLRKIVPGSTDRSYGIHVAKLAGLPFTVLKRAEEMLKTLEKPRQKEQRPSKLAEPELPLFGSPILDELRAIDPNCLTPMQALQTLVNLQKKAAALL